MKTRIVFFSVCLMLATALTAHATVRALVVGIDAYPGENSLPSCVNDARNVADLLMKQFGVPKENVRLLLNADATASGIRRAFKTHLLDTTKLGDEALFYFSGHGSLVQNWSPESRGRVMKVLVPYHEGKFNVTETTIFTQTELKNLLGELRTTNITVILDCCHAGSMTKALKSSVSRDKIKSMNLGYAASEIHLNEEPREEIKIFSKSVGANIPVLWLGACLSNQVSYSRVGGMSRFTGALVGKLQETPKQPMAEVFPQIKTKVEEQTRANSDGVQTPIMEGPAERPLVGGAPVITPPVVTPPPPVELPPPPRVTPPSRQDFPLRISMDRSDYAEGDAMKVEVKAGADCYLRLYVINAAAEQQQLFPNQYSTNNFLRKDQTIEIPAPNTFVLRMSAPFGTETLVAVASLEQFTDLHRPDFSAGGFQDLGNTPPASTGTRGIRVEKAQSPDEKPKNKLSYHSVKYTVSPR